MKHIIFVFFLFCALYSSNLKAQQAGTITGTVVDSESGETLIGVSVVIDGTTKGAATDIDGKYTIRNVDPGTYTILVSYISFTSQSITGVEVEAGETVKLDVVLQPESELLDEIVVTADAVLNNEAGLLRQRQKSIAFSDAISSESISNSGSGDAAGALKKVVGASVVDGKYVFIRGLGDRYTSTHLNGSELPSADPNRKSFQLDIFPSNLLENIVTVKTFTPDKPGSFSGGLVDINTKDFPESFSFQLSASTSYNTQSTFTDLGIGDAGDTDFLGFDGGNRDIPDVVKAYIADNENFPSLSQTRTDPEAAETLDRLSKAWNNEFRPREQEGVSNQSYGFSIGNQFSLFGNDLGYTASLSYSQNYSGYSDQTVGRYNLIGTVDEASSLQTRLEVNDDQGQRNVDWGALATLSYRLGSNHKISSTFLRTQSGSGKGRYLEGFNNDIPTALFQTRVVQYTERSLSSVQLNGKSFFDNFLDATVEWKGSYAVNSQDEPDLRFFTSQVDTFATGAILYSNPTNNFQRPGRFFRNLDESNKTVSVDITVPFTSFPGTNGNFKFGGNLISADRDFREKRFDVYTDPGAGQLLNSVDGDADEFFSLVGIIDTRPNGRPVYGNYYQDATTERGNYDATRDISAVYLMAELPITNWFKLIGGARLEQAEIEVVSQDSSLAIGALDNTDLLPSVSGVFSISDNMNVRTAFTKTVARPTFRELAPYITFDFVGDYLFRGNSELKRTLITNYDLRWEYYSGVGEIIAISGFYKELSNPLEKVIRTDIGNDAISIQNVNEGRVYGLELEVRKNIGFISDFLRHVSVASNLTLVQSEVDIPELELQVIRSSDPDAESTRSLQGQSPYIFNFDVGYENPEIGLTSSVSYNLFGDRLAIVTEGATPDVFERSYGSLNFTSTKTLMNNFELSFKVSNILDPDIISSQKFKGEEFYYSRYKNGRTFSLGIKYKL